MYDLDGVFAEARKSANAKFDEGLDVAVNLNLEKKHIAMVKNSLSLPNSTGKKVVLACFSESDEVLSKAKEMGADVVGGMELIEQIKNTKKVEFDAVVATQGIMPKLSSVASILGPKKLMPSVKSGNVLSVDGVADYVTNTKGGKNISFRSDKFGILHARIGSKSSSDEDLKNNLISFYSSVLSTKPSDQKGVFVKSVAVSFTMGKSCFIDLGSLKEVN